MYKSLIKKDKPVKSQILAIVFAFFAIWFIFLSSFLICIDTEILPGSYKKSPLFEPYVNEVEIIDNAGFLLFFGVIYLYIGKLLWDLRDMGRILAIAVAFILIVNTLIWASGSYTGYQIKKIDLVPSFHPIMDLIIALVLIYFFWFDKKTKRRYH